MVGIIYKITNLINGKIYIGQTIQSLKRRFNNHKATSNSDSPKQYIHRAIRRYGFSNFICEEIEKCSSSLLNEKERFWISEYKSNISEIGYNLDNGGLSIGRLSEESKRKIGEANRGEKSGWFGKNHTEEQKEKISRANKGRKLTKEQISKMVSSIKKVPIVCINNEVIYPSISEAARELGLSKGNIYNVLNDNSKHTKGYKFKRVN